MKNYVKSTSGFATLIALMMLGMLTLIGIAAMTTSDDEVTVAGNELQEMRAFYAAEAGLERATAAMNQEYDSTGAPPTVLPNGTDTVNMCQVVYSTVDDGPAAQRILTTGSLTGLHALVKSFSLSSIATSTVDNAKVEMSQSFETALVPIFQWAVFYIDDIWLEPVFDMNLDGRVHTNGDFFMRSAGTGKTLLFEDRVTCAGDIIHGFPWTGSKGDIKFTDADGNEVSMKQGGNWIDATHANWYDTASSLWGGEVQDAAFGQEALNLPLTNSDDPHKMIERGAGNPDSYQHKAGLQVIDGVPYTYVAGVLTDISASLPAGTITCDASTEFFEAKEEQQVRNTQIDIDKLRTSGYFPSNGVIYVSDQRGGAYMNGTSLVNGSRVGAPLTLATENPLFVQGDFNTVDKQPVAAMSDAVTFLSNSWDPSKATEYDALGRYFKSSASGAYYKSKVPAATEVNISFITGDVEADVAGCNHQGGLENLPRFLEDWNGREMKIRGSMIQMWRSQQATADYTYGIYYRAPSRNWGFDTDLEDPNKLPPETPMVRVFQRTGWKQEHVGL